MLHNIQSMYNLLHILHLILSYRFHELLHISFDRATLDSAERAIPVAGCIRDLGEYMYDKKSPYECEGRTFYLFKISSRLITGQLFYYTGHVW